MANEFRQQKKKLQNELRAVSKLRIHWLGLFHAEMVIQRAIQNTHEENVYNPLYERVGLGGIMEKLMRIASGFHPIAIKTLGACMRQRHRDVALGLT